MQPDKPPGSRCGTASRSGNVSDARTHPGRVIIVAMLSGPGFLKEHFQGDSAVMALIAGGINERDRSLCRVYRQSSAMSFVF